MKKILVLAIIAISISMGQSASAQGLSNLLNKAAGALSDAAGDNQMGNMLSDVISKYTGSMTTTKENLIGTWSYTAPKVQFESDNLLATAGGSTMAQKVESKLAFAYKAVGISEGKLKFTFEADGKVSYALGSKQFSGTYTFDEKNKTISFVIPNVKQNITAYVTISGGEMSLCFDTSKALALFTSVASKFSDNIAKVAGNYEGMKTGFKFKK